MDNGISAGQELFIVTGSRVGKSSFIRNYINRMCNEGKSFEIVTDEPILFSQKQVE